MDELIEIGLFFLPIFFIAFVVTVGILPKWIHRARREKLVGRDIHKVEATEVAEGGGVAVLIGFIIAIFSYVALKTFVFNVQTNLVEILGLVSVILFAGMLGAFDDLLGWKRGLSNKVRIGLLVFSAIPLMAINAGTSTIMGINFGLLYPLILIPLGIVATTSTFNMLAGYNGLEASQGIILLTALGIVTFITGSWWLTVISVSMVFALLGFYLFNKYPAKVFPGDTLTYPVGALIGSIAILGNIEKIAVFFYIPYIIEVILKVRGKLKKESFASVQKDGSLELRYGGRIYGLEHLAIWFLKKIKPTHKVYEWEVPLVINLFQIIIILVGFVLFV